MAGESLLTALTGLSAARCPALAILTRSLVWTPGSFGSLPPHRVDRAALHDWLTHKVRPMFEQRVLAVTEDVMFKWRLLVEEGRKARQTFSQPDLIIAGTAAHHGLVIDSRDISGYERTQVPLFNPWVES